MRAMPQLESLTLRGTVSDAALKQLAVLKRLRCLDLRYADGYTDRGLTFLLDSLPNLETIKFSIRHEPSGGQGRK
jgi:hypothetical protein